MHDIVRDTSIVSLVEAEMSLDLSADGSGQAMHRFISDMYPICRSITGDGVRKTIDLIRDYIPLTTCEVPSGFQVFDWTIPLEWNVRDGYIKNSAGERVVDFRQSNLHLVNYSVPVKARMSLEELKPHLFSDSNRPDWIPYRTSYYKLTWGFCLSHNQLLALPEDDYDVCIDSSLRTRPPDLWRFTAARPFLGGGPDLLPCLSSVALQRQLVRHCGRDGARPTSAQQGSPIYVPLHIRPGHDRFDRMAGAEQGACRADQAWLRPDVRGRFRSCDLQEKSPRKHRNRQGVVVRS